MTTPIYLTTDFYKLSHREQYPVGTTKVYSTLTPRSNKYAPWSDEIVFFGLQYFIKEYLLDRFDNDFFDKPLEEVISTYENFVKHTLGKTEVYTEHLVQLHNLGYLPIKIEALPEGTLAPMRCPVMTIENTQPEFFWLTNFLETILSTTIWQPITSATLAYQYRKVLDEYALKTTGSTAGVEFQGHDFSLRGMSSEQSGMASGMGHLTSFQGTDTIPAIFGANKYYHAPLDFTTGASISATEHSVMCSYGQADELELFKHLLVDVYPTGLFSVVSDTWDFWKVVTEYLPALKDIIMSRDGKLVVRPDSGDPVDIVTGTKVNGTTPEEKGLIECLWDTFGGTINEQGYKVLDSHVGAIYGDSINLERATAISERLEAKGFASTNIVFGIGSFSYQYHTRDTFGFAVKATAATVNGEERMLFKDPKTDDGTKRSQRGRIVVARKADVLAENPDFDFTTLTGDQSNNELLWMDGLNEAEASASTWKALRPVFLDGQMLANDTLATIRERLTNERAKQEVVKEETPLRKYLKDTIVERWSKTK
jgi:nicotinamide phosphoribosyl transferase